MALAAGLGMDPEHEQLGSPLVGIGVGRGPDRGQSDDLLARAGDEEHAVVCAGTLECRAPRARERLGLELRDDLGSQLAAYASRNTTAWTNPTAGASDTRATRTLASARGPGGVVVVVD